MLQQLPFVLLILEALLLKNVVASIRWIEPHTLLSFYLYCVNHVALKSLSIKYWNFFGFFSVFGPIGNFSKTKTIPFKVNPPSKFQLNPFSHFGRNKQTTEYQTASFCCIVKMLLRILRYIKVKFSNHKMGEFIIDTFILCAHAHCTMVIL